MNVGNKILKGGRVMEKQKNLKAGTQYFSTLISEGNYYVDKTMIIKELLDANHTVNLITRPRRFGKSLMLDMLRNFFVLGAERSLFDGLAILNEKELCDNYMGQYPVMLLSLSGFNTTTYRGALTTLATKIGNLAVSFRPLLAEKDIDPQDKALLESYMALLNVNNYPEKTEDFEALLVNAPFTICRILHDHYGKNVVVLIDEYGVPLNKAYLGGFYDDMVDLIKDMFESLLKENIFLKLSVITGCLRISKESIFTGTNNISVWGFEDNFSTEYFGFTEEEVKDLLAYYSVPNVLDTARAWYDGFCFGNEHVYSPWDIIKYVGKCRKGRSITPVNYWADTSDNDILIRVLQASTVSIQKDYIHLLAGGTIQKTVSNALTYRELNELGENIWSLLVTTGYLTIESYVDDADVHIASDIASSKIEDENENADEDEDEKVDEDDPFSADSGKLCELKVPNGEVRQLFGKLLSQWVNTAFHTNPTVISEFCAAFPSGDPDTVEQRLRIILHDVMNSRDMSAQNQQKEYFYHGTVLGLLYSKWKVRSNIQSGDGYCDLGFFCKKKLAVVIEMKFDSKDLEAGAQEALHQIEEKRYTDAFFRDGATKVLRYGIACYRDNCKVLLDTKTSCC